MSKTELLSGFTGNRLGQSDRNDRGVTWQPPHGSILLAATTWKFAFQRLRNGQGVQPRHIQKYEKNMNKIWPGIWQTYNFWGPDLGPEPKNVTKILCLQKPLQWIRYILKFTGWRLCRRPPKLEESNINSWLFEFFGSRDHANLVRIESSLNLP